MLGFLRTEVCARRTQHHPSILWGGWLARRRSRARVGWGLLSLQARPRPAARYRSRPPSPKAGRDARGAARRKTLLKYLVEALLDARRFLLGVVVIHRQDFQARQRRRAGRSGNVASRRESAIGREYLLHLVADDELGEKFRGIWARSALHDRCRRRNDEHAVARIERLHRVAGRTILGGV